MGNPSWDLFLVGFVVGALLWFIPGKDRIIHMVSIYMALAVVTLPEFVLNIKVNILHVGLRFLICLYCLVLFVIRQAVLNAWLRWGRQVVANVGL